MPARRQVRTRNFPEGVKRATAQGVPPSMRDARFKKLGERSDGTVPRFVRKIVGR